MLFVGLEEGLVVAVDDGGQDVAESVARPGLRNPDQVVTLEPGARWRSVGAGNSAARISLMT